jgi:hypothetical protein
MGQAEPRSNGSRSNAPVFMIGKDSHGHWVVQNQRGLRGGMFIDRAAALHFALFENGNRPQAVIMVPGVFELRISGTTPPARHLLADADIRSYGRTA